MVRPKRRFLFHYPSVMLDPIRLRRYIIIGIKVLIVLELAGAVTQGASGGGWDRLGFDLVVAGVLYLMWGRITALVARKREESRKAIETSGENLRLWDALAFSLLWTDEIYSGIPMDRLRLVLISYTLITLGILAAFLSIGSGFMPLIVSGALVLAAVNLLAWVVSSERDERDSLQTELRLAHDVQMSLMPAGNPRVEGFDIAGKSIPAKEVGGDHFAYGGDPVNEGLFSISVFDVSGKGMQAAMSAVFVSGIFAGEGDGIASPAEVLSALNRAVYRHSRRGQFIAFLLLSIDIRKRILRFSNAGQSRPLLISDGKPEWLEGEGVNFPLGMVPDSCYKNREVPLKPGDTLLLMTDGFTEAMNRGKELFGQERIERFVTEHGQSGLSSAGLIEALTKEVQTFIGSIPQNDDMTIVVLRVLPESA